MFRKYLVTIHRFLYRYVKVEHSLVFKTVLIFGLTLFSFLCWIDSYLESPLIKQKNDALIFYGFPIFIGMIPVYYWYKINKPDESELSRGKDAWTGNILFWLCMILLAFFRKFYV